MLKARYNKILKYQLSLIAVFILYSGYYSQHSNFTYFTTSPNGLSQSVVNNITQDSKGFLWLSTNSGLNKFDGVNFKTFYREDGLKSKEVNCISERESGEIWVATKKGLNLIKDNNIILLKTKLFPNQEGSLENTSRHQQLDQLLLCKKLILNLILRIYLLYYGMYLNTTQLYLEWHLHREERLKKWD